MSWERGLVLEVRGYIHDFEAKSYKTTPRYAAMRTHSKSRCDSLRVAPKTFETTSELP
jgi:hypothetical protein